MPKIIFHIIFFILGIILQFSFNQYLSISGVAPNYILIFIIFFSLTRGSLSGEVFGFLWGIAWDVFSIKLFGCHAFIYTCIGFFVGMLSKKWDENKISTQMFVTFFASVFYWAAIILLYQFFGEGRLKINYIVILQPVVNTLLAPLIFKVCSSLVDFFDVYPKRY